MFAFSLFENKCSKSKKKKKKFLNCTYFALLFSAFEKLNWGTSLTSRCLMQKQEKKKNYTRFNCK